MAELIDVVLKMICVYLSVAIALASIDENFELRVELAEKAYSEVDDNGSNPTSYQLFCICFIGYLIWPKMFLRH